MSGVLVMRRVRSAVDWTRERERRSGERGSVKWAKVVSVLHSASRSAATSYSKLRLSCCLIQALI